MGARRLAPQPGIERSFATFFLSQSTTPHYVVPSIRERVFCRSGGWGVAIRTFRDARGREWQVWETVPQGSAGQYSTRLEVEPSAADRLSGRVRLPVSEGREYGWLTFAAGDDKRRLSPIPGGWAESSDEQLARYFEQARPVAPVEAPTKHK